MQPILNISVRERIHSPQWLHGVEMLKHGSRELIVAPFLDTMPGELSRQGVGANAQDLHIATNTWGVFKYAILRRKFGQLIGCSVLWLKPTRICSCGKIGLKEKLSIVWWAHRWRIRVGKTVPKRMRLDVGLAFLVGQSQCNRERLRSLSWEGSVVGNMPTSHEALQSFFQRLACTGNVAVRHACVFEGNVEGQAQRQASSKLE